MTLYLRVSGALILAAYSFASVAEVKVQGLDGELLQNVESWLGIRALAKAAEPRVVRRLHNRASSEIRQALQPFGYYAPEIDAQLEMSESSWRATYIVRPGQAVIVEDVQLDISGAGRDEPSLSKATRPLLALRGQRLRHQDYEDGKRQLLEAAFRRGFLDAEFIRPELRVDVPNRRADIQLALSTGPQYRFGPVQIRQSALDPDFMARYIDIKAGEPFDSDRLLALRLRLFDLDYFSRVEVEVERDEATENEIPVTVVTTLRPAQFYKAGFGFGTDTGPRFTGQLEFRRLNRHGHRFRTDLRFSEVLNGISSKYEIPAGRVPGNRWTLSGSASKELLGNSTSDLYKAGLSRSLVRGSRLWRGYVQYERELFRLEGANSNTDLLTPGVSLSLRSADDSLFPRRGYRLFIDVHGASDTLLSTASFLQTRLILKTIMPLGHTMRVLNRVEFGASLVKEFSELPPSQRFFAGGDQSVRGYGYQELAPRSRDGELLGGEYLLAASTELDWLFFKNYGLGLFFDIGSASDDLAGDLASGAGLGFRWRSPVGMLRFDFAHPFDDPNESFRIHVGIGADL